MSSGKRAMRPIRQLSLQQSAPRRQHIKRQRSADDGDKSLQIYADPTRSEKPQVRVAWGDDHRGDGDLEQVRVVARQIPNRSRPTTGRHQSGGRNYIGATEKRSILYSRQELAERLRLAWKHRESRANIDIFLAHGFAVEEPRCDSELSARASTTSPLSSEEPDPVVRDRDRDEGKIRSSSEGTGRGEETTTNDVLGESRNADPDRRSEAREINGGEEIVSPRTTENDPEVDPTMVSKDEEKNTERSAEKEREECANPDVREIKRTRISIDCTSLQSPYSSTAAVCQPTTTASKESDAIAATEVARDFSSARQKRASFHSGTNRAFLIAMPERGSARRSVEASRHPATIVSMKSIETRCSSADKNKDERQRQTRTPETRSPIVDRNGGLARGSSTVSVERTRRTNSAPPQRQGSAASVATRVQVNIVIDAPGLGEAASDRPIVCGPQDGKNAERGRESQTKISRERPIRSAPLRRRSKSARRRFLTPSCSKDEEDARSRGAGGRTRASVDPKTTDVVTMVSLISSADSDSDVENSPRDDKLISELRNKLSTAPIIKTSINHNPSIAKKPIKSVSFQRDSSDEEEETLLRLSTREEKRTAGVHQSARLLNLVGGSSGHEDALFSSRQQDAPDGGTATPLPTVSALMIQDIEETGGAPETTTTTTTPLTDREKRCLAVPIGDLRDDRKPPRTRSVVPSRPIVSQQTTSDNAPMEMREHRPYLAPGSATPIDNPLTKVEQYAEETPLERKMPPRGLTLPSEPNFRSTKEKECWHLYRRMCDKGVCVSFDTVLRGMLTPTEYRLRQKELSQDLR